MKSRGTVSTASATLPQGAPPAAQSTRAQARSVGALPRRWKRAARVPRDRSRGECGRGCAR
eukprot:3701382-Prymnesium_polylepis.1